MAKDNGLFSAIIPPLQNSSTIQSLIQKKRLFSRIVMQVWTHESIGLHHCTLSTTSTSTTGTIRSIARCPQARLAPTHPHTERTLPRRERELFNPAGSPPTLSPLPAVIVNLIRTSPKHSTPKHTTCCSFSIPLWPLAIV